MKKKTELENYLDKYYFASMERIRLNSELAYPYSYNQIMLDVLLKKMAKEVKIIDEIEDLIDQAGLNKREREYIRLRHFEQNSMVQIEFKMFVAGSTVDRIRKTALKKLKAALL